MSKKYFAADTIDVLMSECVSFMSNIRTAYGIYNVRERNTGIYYQNVLSDPISPSGSRGELVSMSIPRARRLVRDYVSIVTKQKLKFKATTKTHEYTNWADMKIVDALIEYILKTQKIEDKRDKLTENAFVLGQSFLWVTWDQFKGREVTNPVSGIKEKSGSAEIKSIHPNRVFYNPKSGSSGNWEDVQWCLVEYFGNKYDLAAQHPEFKDALEALSPVNSDIDTLTGSSNLFTNSENEEIVKVYHFYHAPSEALPQGRMAIFCDNNISLYDGQNPYECLPVFPCIPETIDDLILGYPSFSNLVAAQEMLDHNYSVIASNQSAWGLQSMLNPRGSDLSAKQIFGVNFIDYTPAGPDGGGKPEPIQFPKTPDEIFGMADRYSNTIDSLGGINAALRGQAPGGVTAASAIATLTANALEFISSYSRCVHICITDALTFAAKLYYMFGAEEQFIDLADGVISTQKKFNRDILANFDKLEIEITNPLLNSYSFNLNSATELLNQGLIRDPKTYFRVLEGDRTSIMYDDDLQELMLIQLENDDLMQGQECPVLFQDDDDLHLMHHKKLVMNPRIRRNMDPKILQGILQHMEAHEAQKAQKAGPSPAQGTPNVPNTPAAQDNSPNDVTLPSNTQGPIPAKPALPAKAPISL